MVHYEPFHRCIYKGIIEMSNHVLTCDSCGKQYRALPGAETVPESERVLCSTCWAEAELRVELEKAEKNLTSTGFISKDPDTAMMHKCSELEGEITELRTRLTLKEEAELTALKERELAIESRQKLEKTLAEFLTRFAATRHAESTASRELDSVRKESQSTIVGLRSQLDSSGQIQKAFEMERNIRTQLESKVCELTAIVAHERDVHSAELKNREKSSEATRELEAQVLQLNTQLSAFHDEKSALDKKSSESTELIESLEKDISLLRSQVTELQFSQTSTATVSEERDAALRDRQTLQIEVSELKEWLKIAQEAQMASVREREEAIEQLKNFRDAALSCLEPMGMECNRDMKELISENESVLGEARRLREETASRMDKLERMSGDLRTHMNNVRRQITSRLSNVLGTSANLSGLHGAIFPASPSPAQPVVESPALKQVAAVSGAA